MTHPTKNAPVGAGLKPGPTTSAAPSQQTATAPHRRTATTEFGPLPEEWQVVRLGDFTSLETGRRAKGGALSNGEVWSLGGEHITETGQIDFWKNPKFIPLQFFHSLRKGIVRPNDVLIVKDGARTGKSTFVAKLPHQYIAVNEHIFIVRSTNSQHLFPPYLGMWTRSQMFWAQISEAYHGLIGGINRRDLQTFILPLPPLPEQRAIAHVLRSVQEAREATENVIAALREVKKSLMRHLFTYGPVPVGARRAVPLQQTDIGPIPTHWRVVRLGQIVTTTSGGTPNRSNPKYFGGAIPWIKSGELRDAPIFESQEFITQDGLQNSNAKIFSKGTLLIAMYGATAGKVGILKINAATNQAICALLPNDINTLPEYLFYTLIYRREALKAQRYGGAQPNLSQRAIRSFQIPLPPLAEQREIARQLQTLDRKIEAEEARKNALDDLFRSFLHHLMTAQRRLPADFIARFTNTS